MGRTVSEETKLKQNRGTGRGKDYLPWMLIRELNCKGTSTSLPDWKHGRMIQLLSQAELWWYYKLRWNDEVIDIREHFPLNLKETTEIANYLSIYPMQYGKKHMNTDMVLTLDDGNEIAICVKANCNEDLDRRTIQNLMIEEEYWKLHNVPYYVVYKSDLNPLEILNIKNVITSYDSSRVYDDFSLVRHLIAHKLIQVDMTKEIDFKGIIKEMKEEEIWTQYRLLLE